MARLHRKAPEGKVYIDGREFPDTHLISVTRSINGARQDSAVFEIVPVGKQTQPRWQDQDIIVNNRSIGVEIVGANGLRKVVHWGKGVAADVSESGAAGDSVFIHSRLDDHLFGDNQYWVYYATRELDKKSDAKNGDWTYAQVHGEIVFNPVIDKVPQPNCFVKHVPKRGQWIGWIHPDSLPRTKLNSFLQREIDNPSKLPRRDADGIGFAYWSLPAAVHSMCWMLNPDEKYIKNPLANDLIRILDKNPNVIRNLRITQGDSLPQVLDKLLTPFGYIWFVEHESLSVRKIVVQKRGEGETEWLKRLRVGEDVDWTEEAASAFELNYDLTNRAANLVRVVGDFMEAESTFELMPAWDPIDDNVKEENMTLDHATWKDNSNLIRTWRDWVYNENGDYTGLREKDKRFDEAPDLKELFSDHNAVVNMRRRRFHPMISVAKDGTPAGSINGCIVEYWNIDQKKWCPIYSGEKGRGGLSEHPDVELLDNEMGIRFVGEKPPMKLIAYARKTQPADVSRVKLRITASVRIDFRLIKEAKARRSLIFDTRPITVVSDRERFQSREVHESSAIGDGFDVDSREVDGGPACQEQAKLFLDSWNHATMDGRVMVNGVDWVDLKLGTTVLGLENRDVSFKLSANGVRPDKYPTVTSITYQFQDQQTILELDTWREFS